MSESLTALQTQLWLSMVQQCCRAEDISFDELARAALLDIARPRGLPPSLTLYQLDRLLLAVERHLKDKGRGLFVAMLVLDFDRVMGHGPVLSAKQTLGAAGEYLLRYLPHMHPGYAGEMELMEDGSCLARLRISHVRASARHCHQLILSGFVINLLQRFPGQEQDGARVHEVRLPSALIQSHPELSAWQVPLQVDEEWLAVRGDSRMLAREAPNYSAGMEDALQRILDVILQQDCVIDHQPSRVVDVLLEHVESGRRAGLPDIALALGIKQRTLQHHLNQEGLSFNRLRGQVQAHVACDLIARGCSTDEIVTSLGYSSRSAFHHAFTRITGQRPAQVRRNLRSQLPEPPCAGKAPPPRAL